MSIHFDEKTKQFHLRAGNSSYVLQIYKDRYLAHRYFGSALHQERFAQPLIMVNRSFSPNPDPSDRDFSLDTLPQEYPTYGTSDFRSPALEVRSQDGSSVIDLCYAGHRIFDGKRTLAGLPATYVESDDEAQTLEVDLSDTQVGLAVTLRYTAFARHSVIARSVSVSNVGEQHLRLGRVLSAAFDMPDAEFEFMQLTGAHLREREVQRGYLASGGHWVESRRGTSSHQQNPFFAWARPHSTETAGEVYAVSLLYSGNFLIGAEVDQYRTARVLAGINPFDFEWLLEPGETFCAPEALLAHSSVGFGGLSRDLHRLFRTRLARGAHRDQPRPILINNWEATYFDFDKSKLVSLGASAAELGIELFVLDDGWFGQRDDDHSSLGDWVVDGRKLPDGLSVLAADMSALGLQLGLWVEPEMVSPDSNLYREHPDWCLHVVGRGRSQGRNQLVLDFSRADVCDAILDQLTAVLRSAPIRYVKWDMNRHLTEVGSALLPPERQRETAHRYVLGLYRVLDSITRAFPDILFESCSGGGGRYDPGMLYYMPQVWTSDNTDAIGRLSIQSGTSMAYPSIVMGSHVSAVPNHQVGRITPLATRGLVAMMGNLGYELDVRQLAEGDRRQIQWQIKTYKAIRHLVLFGDLHRLRDPASRRDAAWMYVSEDRKEAFVTYVRILADGNPPLDVLRLCGLDRRMLYRVEALQDEDHPESMPEGIVEITAGGDELMSAGLVIPPLWGDFRACAWHLQGI